MLLIVKTINSQSHFYFLSSGISAKLLENASGRILPDEKLYENASVGIHPDEKLYDEDLIILSSDVAAKML